MGPDLCKSSEAVTLLLYSMDQRGAPACYAGENHMKGVFQEAALVMWKIDWNQERKARPVKEPLPQCW